MGREPTVSEALTRVACVGKSKVTFVCRACRQQLGQWAGRCPSCGEWGSVDESVSGPSTRAAVVRTTDLGGPSSPDPRVRTGVEGVDRVLGGGVVPGSVILLAGEPGIGKSTLLLQLVGRLAEAGQPCLLVSGEESRDQVAGRARRIGVAGQAVSFASGRDLTEVIETARAAAPFLLAVDSIQTLRDAGGLQMPGGVSQVRLCTDALVGLAKSEGIAVLLTGHVTKDGDLAGPRALEHAVDVVLTFDGDARSGLRVLAGGKNRFGTEGEVAWFEMGAEGLMPIDPSDQLVPGDRVPGAAVALPRSGRRALAVEIQALVGGTEGPARRQATGLDARRFQLVAAVLERNLGLALGRAELFGATAGGLRIDDPACDLATAAAIASAATGALPPAGSAFVGEVALTGLVRIVPGMAQRLQAARTAGCEVVFVPEGHMGPAPGVRTVEVRHLREALTWALSPATTAPTRLPA
jgi:DNA repair protein RadA/Sms